MDMKDQIILLVIGLTVGAIITVVVLTRRIGTQSPSYKVVHTYNNLEEWTFVKDGDGRVQGVRVTRRAEQD